MGTNYYHRHAACPTCGHGIDRHIGKSSAGWTFSFAGHRPEIMSYADWLRLLEEGGEIRNEYGEQVTLDDFRALVESKRTEELNHTTYCREHHPEYAERDCWLDEEGHSFSAGEWS
jgi:hypothetical protein